MIQEKLFSFWQTLEATDVYLAIMTFVLIMAAYLFSTHYLRRVELLSKAREVATGTKKKVRASQGAQAKKQKNKKAFKDQMKTIESFLKTYSSRFMEERAADYKLLFEQAGWSPLNATVIYLGVKVLSTIAFILGGIFATTTLPFLVKQGDLIQIWVVLASALLGLSFFDYLIKAKISVRYKGLQRDLSSALDLLVICTNAGLSIDRSFEQVAQELSTSNPDLCKEFAMASIELSILPERQNAFRNLGKRLDLSLIRGLVTTLIQSEEQGTSVSQTLRVLSHEFREQKILSIEERAQKLPAILAIPVVLFTLPSLMIMILGPTMINLIKNIG